MKTITKDSIASKIQKDLGFSKNFADDFVSSIFNEMKSIIKKDGKIVIPNLGSFVIHQKNARPGRDIKRNIAVTITARKTIKYSASRNLREAINGK